MNPFKPNIYEHCRNFIRLVLWLALAVNAGIAACWFIVFVWNLAIHSWQWLSSVWFSGSWAVETGM